MKLNIVLNLFKIKIKFNADLKEVYVCPRKKRMIETNALSIFLTDPKISKYLGITIYNHHPENFRQIQTS